MAEEVSIIVRARDNASGALRGIGSALADIGKIAAGILTADLFRGIANGMLSAVTAGMKMDAMLEETTLQFETLMGSADGAKQHVKDLFAFAAKTPFETEPIIKASKALLTFGGAALDTQENLQLVGDAAAAVGQNIDEVAFWTGRAYSMIQGGRPFGEAAMRLQEMGILSAEARNEMEKLQKKGASAAKIWGVLEKQYGKFNGAMEKQARTWKGLTSTISDNLKMAMGTAIQPFFDMVKEGMGKIADYVSSEKFSEWAKKLSDFLKPAARALGDFLKRAMNLFNYLQTGGKLAWDTMTTYLFGSKFTKAINEVIEFFTPLIDAFKNLFSALQASAPIAGSMVSDIFGRMAAIFAELVTVHLPAFVNWLAGVLPGAIQTLSIVWSTVLLPAIQDAWQWITTVLFPALAELWTWLGANLPGAIAALSNWWTTKLIPAVQSFVSFWNTILWPALVLVGTWIGTVLFAAFQGWVNFFTVTIPAAITTLVTFWNTILWPALQVVWSWISAYLIPLFMAIANVMEAVVGLAIRVLTGLWQNVLLPALKAVWNYISALLMPIFKQIADFLVATFGPTLKASSKLIDAITNAFKWLGSAIQDVIDWLSQLADMLNDLELPDWLQPGSPTPFETGLRGIGKALKDVAATSLPEFKAGIDMRPTAGSLGDILPTGSPRGGNQNNSSYTLIINEAGQRGNVASDFQLLQALTGA